MKDMILFDSYSDNKPYIFLGFDKAEKQTASIIINYLIEKQFRICYVERDDKAIADADFLANRILLSDLTIFLLSVPSVQSLEYRNCINYALSKKKKVFCIYVDDEELGFGLDMQLANTPRVRLADYEDVGKLCEDIIKLDYFVQDMRGEDAKISIKHNRRKTVAIAAMVSIIVLFFAAAAVIAVDRINYENSLAGQIEKLTEVDYLDISDEDASIIELLRGKTIDTLAARNMGLTDIEALGYVDCEDLDISGNPTVNTLEPLLNSENLKTVKVSQDMYPAIFRINGRHQFKIVINE